MTVILTIGIVRHLFTAATRAEAEAMAVVWHEANGCPAVDRIQVWPVIYRA